MKNIEEYELIFDPSISDEEMNGVYAVSLVSDPANEQSFVYFSSDESNDIINIKLANEERRVVVCPILIPEQRIMRKAVGSEQKPGVIFAKAETIEQLQENFFESGYNKNSTLEHIEVIDGVFFFESWIVLNKDNDKSSELGFNVPNGTWMMSMKIKNDQIWNDYIKTGKVKGLSIDGLLRAVKIKEQKKIELKMNKQTIQDIVNMSIMKVAMQSELNKFDIEGGLSVYASELKLDSVVVDAGGLPIPDLKFVVDGMEYETDSNGIIVSSEKVEIEDNKDGDTSDLEDIKLGEMKTQDGDTTLYFDGNMITKGGEIFKDEKKTILEDGTYILESGVSAIVEGGKVIDLIEAEKPENSDEQKPESSINEEKLTEYENKIKDLEAKVSILEEENGKLKADLVLKENEVVTLSKEKPASSGIPLGPTINFTEKDTKKESLIDTLKRVSKK